VRSYRVAQGLKQCHLERITGIAHSTIFKVENYKMTPRLYLLEKLAAGLSVPVTWLLEPVTNERLAEIFAVKLLQEVRASDVCKQVALSAIEIVLNEQTLRRTG
jgi:transcriptional regulator with XRE-family HTH domain